MLPLPRSTAVAALRLARSAQKATKKRSFSLVHLATFSRRCPSLSVKQAVYISSRSFSTSRLMAFAQPPPAEGNAVLSQAMYNQIADDTLDSLLVNLEALQEEREDVDVEFSAGVLTLKLSHGTYVINKQPPNKQIWLSSPVSGPKRYDWNGELGEWVYARDGSTLKGLLVEEVGVSYEME
ncbi:hypothetical protein RUND412_005614 [Rhizina undulata]